MTQMTLDEAIRHAEEVAKRLKTSCKRDWMGEDDERCASEHRQLAEWLKDYKRLLEQQPCEDAISRKSLKQKLQEHHDFFVNAYGGFSNLSRNDKSRVDEISNCIAMVINEPPITPQPEIGYWIRWYERKETEQYRENIPHCNCSKCGKEYDPHSSKFIKFCSHCGAKMREAGE